MKISKISMCFFILACSLFYLKVYAQDITFQSKKDCQEFVNEVVNLYHLKYNPNVFFQEGFERAPSSFTGDLEEKEECPDSLKNKEVSISQAHGSNLNAARDYCEEYYKPCLCTKGKRQPDGSFIFTLK
ncbi:MAG: hypothetical protein HYS98_06385 [Deltaproteobacteria bacterium]|nr:hypothetical protein [Deltaproteobacteria bacterium]